MLVVHLGLNVSYCYFAGENGLVDPQQKKIDDLPPSSKHYICPLPPHTYINAKICQT